VKFLEGPRRPVPVCADVWSTGCDPAAAMCNGGELLLLVHGGFVMSSHAQGGSPGGGGCHGVQSGLSSTMRGQLLHLCEWRSDYCPVILICRLRGHSRDGEADAMRSVSCGSGRRLLSSLHVHREVFCLAAFLGCDDVHKLLPCSLRL